MSELLIDTSILVDFLRGRNLAQLYLHSRYRATRLTTHSAVVAELISGARDTRELAAIDRLVATFHVHRPTPDDMTTSLESLRRLRLSTGVGWLDCLIAATAARIGATVVSLDKKHFSRFESITLEVPY
ncbi:MAG: PIN domain-containing protein [Phycisphaerales bacterium]|nr:PIN domain-containing protein [Phycisphaerales bacterium]